MQRRLALTVLLLGVASLARAADLQLVPVLVELTPAEPRAFVVVRNLAAAPVRLELTASAWDESRDGTMRLAPAPDLVVYPPLLEIPSRSERKVRISTTAAFGAAEKPFRLFVQELPPAEKPKQKVGVTFLTRIGIPVFLAPRRVELAAEVVDAKVAGGRLTFLLRNNGTTRLSPTTLRVEGRLSDGRTAYSTDVDSWYVLAGGDRAFDVAIPPGECSRVTAVVVEVPLGDGKVTGRVETPGGACGP